MREHNWLSWLIADKKRVGYLLIFILCGTLLMLFPDLDQQEKRGTEETVKTQSFSVESEELRLEEIISAIEGVGKCKVLLSVYDSSELILAEDEGETVVLSDSGSQSPIIVQTKYPTFQGAVIVAGGCEDPTVRYDILSSVVSYTGLGVDRITICPIKH